MVNENILFLFYQSVVRNILVFNQVCYYNNVKRADAERLERITGIVQIIRHHHLESPTRHEGDHCRAEVETNRG